MKESKDFYNQELDKLKKLEAFKSELYDKSIGGDFPRPPDSFIELHVGKQKTDEQLKNEAFNKSADMLLKYDNEKYYQNYHMTKDQQQKADREKTPKDQHFDKVMDKYADKFKDQQSEFNQQAEQKREEQGRDDDMQR